MTGWSSWKRVLGVAGALGLIVAVAALTQPSSLECGNYVLGRWIAPYFAVMMAVGAGGLLLLAGALLLNEASAKVWGQRLAMLGGSLLVTLVLIDIGLRVTDPPPAQGVELYVNDDRLGYFFRPNQRYESNSPHDEYKAVFYTDAQGLVIRDGSNAPRPDAYRIMFLGDSMLRGIEVAADANLSVLAAHQLEEAWDGDVQQVNLGVSGYSPTHYLIAYRAFREEYDPNLVVVIVYVGNDFTEDARMYIDDQVISDGNGQPVSIRPQKDYERSLIWTNYGGYRTFKDVQETLAPRDIWRSGLLPTLNRLALVPLCRRLEFATFEASNFDSASMQGQPVDDGSALECRDLSGDLTPACLNYAIRDETHLRNNYDGIFKKAPDNLDRRDLEYSLNALRLLASEVRADGRDLLVVVLPASNQIPGQGIGIKGMRGLRPNELIETTKPQQIMADLCADLSLDCIDMLPVFLEHADEELYWVYDAHLTPRGHALIAGTIVAHLSGDGGQ